MGRPIIALLTDFGLRDHYAGTMKGVVLGICPDATLVDITHDMPPHDVLAGALELAAAYRYFPPGTIFLVVVDPGVGSGRGDCGRSGRLPLRRARQRRAVDRLRRARARTGRRADDERYARPTMSRTFEGRDRFAPAAAWLAKGLDLTALGAAGRADPSARHAEAAQIDRRRARRRGAARRSLRQPDHEHRSPGSSKAFAPDAPVIVYISVPTGVECGLRPTPTCRPGSSARCSAAPSTSRSPRTARARPKALARRPRRRRARPPQRVIAFPARMISHLHD